MRATPPIFTLRVLATFLATLVLVSSAVAHAEISVMGFQAWKISRIEEAKAVLERLQQDAVVDKAPSVERGPGERGAVVGAKSSAPMKAQADSNARVQRSSRSDQRLQQAQLNLEIAQDFSVHDYFVLYLSQFKEKEAFVEAAKKLSPDETADLMMSYQKAMNGTQQTEVAPPSGLLPMRTSQTPERSPRNPL